MKAAIAPSLVGVMGAGLLVFVRNDLEAVVEVNQGKRAFNLADAGAQAARRELLSQPDLTYTMSTAPTIPGGPTRGKAMRRTRL